MNIYDCINICIELDRFVCFLAGLIADQHLHSFKSPSYGNSLNDFPTEKLRTYIWSLRFGLAFHTRLKSWQHWMPGSPKTGGGGCPSSTKEICALVKIFQHSAERQKTDFQQKCFQQFIRGINGWFSQWKTMGF